MLFSASRWQSMPKMGLTSWWAAGQSESWLVTLGVSNVVDGMARLCIATVHVIAEELHTCPQSPGDPGADSMDAKILSRTAGFDSQIMLVHDTQWSRSFLRRAIEVSVRPAELEEVRKANYGQQWCL